MNADERKKKVGPFVAVLASQIPMWISILNHPHTYPSPTHLNPGPDITNNVFLDEAKFTKVGDGRDTLQGTVRNFTGLSFYNVDLTLKILDEDGHKVGQAFLHYKRFDMDADHSFTATGPYLNADSVKLERATAQSEAKW